MRWCTGISVVKIPC